MERFKGQKYEKLRKHHQEMGAYAPNHALDEVDRFYLDAALIIHSSYQTKNRMVECKVCRLVLPRNEPTLL